MGGTAHAPREVATNGHCAVVQRPAREIGALRGAAVVTARGRAAACVPRDLGAVGRCPDVTARLHRSPDGRAAAGLRLPTSSDGGEHLDISLDPATGELVADRSRASREPRARGGR
ncbi:hypothetical protein BTM25_48090 [Actinomadura rubteroloni]|uniref:Uncharacterized protein n=1 Tax=Actinomadura rubteroloni TaxID=1926885 RepID=A0A2P4UF27_9ACTN|nr:GH32 C-terminal domain-containing protein [Actinomadura rubteroloni]POM23649.1 hypothetical protein BTM25_48090 [Actinomadura rubteroloni]